MGSHDPRHGYSSRGTASEGCPIEALQPVRGQILQAERRKQRHVHFLKRSLIGDGGEGGSEGGSEGGGSDGGGNQGGGEGGGGNDGGGEGGGGQSIPTALDTLPWCS